MAWHSICTMDLMKLASSLLLLAALTPALAAAHPLAQGSCATAVPLSAALANAIVQGSGNPGGERELWVRVQLEAGESLFVMYLSQLDLGPDVADLHYQILDDACGTVLASGPADDAPLRYFAASQTVIRFGLRDASAANTRTLVLWGPFIEADGCDRQQLDPLEPNNSEATAFPISAGTLPGLNARTGDPDYFLLQVSPGERLDLTLLPLYLAPSFGRVEIELSDALTGEVLESRYLASASGPLSITYLEDSPTPRSLLLQIQVPVEFSCFGYDLEVESRSEPCSRLLEDALEGPDKCGQGTVLGTGIYPGLAVFGGDADFYELDVPLHAAASTSVEVTIRAPLQLPAASIRQDCGSIRYQLTAQPDGSLRGLIELPAGISTRPSLQVFVPSGLVDRCLAYDLEVTLHSHPLGVSFCAQPLSNAVPDLRIWGEDSVASNRLWLTLGDEPTSMAPFIVLAGNQRDMAPFFSPFGSNAIGTLCLGGNVRRAASAYATFTPVGVRVDLDVPALAVLQAGTTWIFQGYLSSNTSRGLTNAVAVTLR